MKCKSKACGAMKYLEGITDYVDTDYWDRIDFYASSLSLMDELAYRDYVDCGSSSKLTGMIMKGCAACPGNTLNDTEVSTLVEKVGGVMKFLLSD